MIVGEIPKPSHPDVRRDKNTNRIVNLRGFEVMIEQKRRIKTLQKEFLASY